MREASPRPAHTPSVAVRERASEFATPIDWSGWSSSDEEDMGQSPEQY